MMIWRILPEVVAAVIPAAHEDHEKNERKTRMGLPSTASTTTREQSDEARNI